MKFQIILITFFIALISIGVTHASDTNITNQSNATFVNTSLSADAYNIGKPILTNIWVDPVNGNDNSSGTASSSPIRSLNTALNLIPQSSPLNTTGFRIILMPGNYTETNLPSNGWIESLYGTYNYPILIQSANNSKRANIKTEDIFNLYNCHYVYLIGINFESNANNVVHLEKCDHILLKNVTIKGTGNISDYTAPQEDLKANQCKNIFLEDSEIYNAWNVPVDFVAVQNGHILNNRIHNAGDWVVYLKGGSSHFLISGNEIYNALNGGFSAGQGTGFEYMESPYIHYETYDIKFVNNIIHDTDGAGMGSSGSYNTLMAYNTLYRIGKNSHVLEFGHGIRSCGGNTAKCHLYLTSGGWGTEITGNEERIPNKNVYVFNNIIYNPTGYQSQWSQLSVANPVIPSPGSNIPPYSRADGGLIIKGNIMWNGPSDLPIGIEEVNTLLNITQLKAQNYINTLKPQLINPENGNFRPLEGGNVFNITTYPIPSFPGIDSPNLPQIYVGNVNNSIIWDYDKNLRNGSKPPGAFAYSYLDVTNPTVASSDPVNNAVNVPSNKIIKVTFNENIKNGTGWIELKTSSGTTVPITTSISGNTLTINHTTLLTNNTTYNILLHTGSITNLAGNPLSLTGRTFTTSTDTIAPVMVSSDPVINSVNVPRNKTVKVTFSEPIKAGNLWIELYNGTTQIPINKTITGNILTITHSALLAANTKYTLCLHTSSITDLAGNPLAIFTRVFTTGNT